jgi:hypothetical protein
MWPLGGLAFCRPPHHWRAHLVTAIGGPLVNVAIFVVLAPVLGLLTGQWLGVAIPNPLAITLPILTDGRQPLWLVAIYLTHYTSLIILLFNLLPVFPLDGGRIVQAGLWPRFGYVHSMRLAVYTGYVGAIGLLIFALVLQDMMLGFIAVFGGITCYITIKQLEWTETFMGEQDDVFAESLWGTADDTDDEEQAASPTTMSRAERRAAKQAEAEEAESREIDRILAKIASEGIEKLTGRERQLLQKATERRKQQDG